MRVAVLSDVELLFDWTNEKEVRSQSYVVNKVSFENHKKWFEKK